MTELTEIEKRNREYLKKNKPLAYIKVCNYDKQEAMGRGVPMVQIHAGYACNFRCQHCMSSDLRKRKDKYITLDDIRYIYNQLDEYGIAQSDFSGGEPLILPNLGEILMATGIKRFFMAIASNAWYLTEQKAFWLKETGVDRMYLSLDSLNEKEHDDFRRMPGSYRRVISGMEYVHHAGMNLKVTSVITHQRVRSDEFRDFIKFLSDKGTEMQPVMARPMGEWTGRTDILLTDDDIKFAEDTYGLIFHTSPHYGIKVGCCAVKKLLMIDAFGNVCPCAWAGFHLGNILQTPFKDIMSKGMKYYKKYHANCRFAQDIEFLDNYNKKIKGKILPIPVEEVWNESI